MGCCSSKDGSSDPPPPENNNKKVVPKKVEPKKVVPRKEPPTKSSPPPKKRKVKRQPKKKKPEKVETPREDDLWGEDCGICGLDLRYPRILDCEHYYCLPCLKELESGNRITCPDCGHVTVIRKGLRVRNLRRKYRRTSEPCCRMTLVKNWHVRSSVSTVKAVSGRGVVCVGLNTPGEALRIYTLGGELVAKVTDDLDMTLPLLTLDTKRQRVVAAAGGSIQLLNAEGATEATLTPGDAEHVQDIVYMAEEDLYVVADSGSRRLLFLSPETGATVRAVPAEEARETADGFRNVWLAASRPPHPARLATVDHEGGLLRVYDAQGALLSTHTGAGCWFGRLRRPNGVCFDHQNRILISDWYTQRIVRVTMTTGKVEVVMETASVGLGHPRMFDVTEDGMVAMAMYTEGLTGPYHIAILSGYE